MCVLDGEQSEAWLAVTMTQGVGGALGEEHMEAGPSVAKKKGESECSTKLTAGSKLQTKAHSDRALCSQCQKSM